MIVRRACPKAHEIRAEFLYHVRGVNAVAERLVHRLALAVNRPAVGETFLIGSAHAQRADRDEQGGLEPAAILIAAFHVHIGRPEALIALHRRVMSGAGVEPAVKRIRLLGEVLSAAVRADKALRQQRRSVLFKPCVGAFLFKNGCDGLN